MSETHSAMNVTKTYLSPLEDYVRYLEGIWERGQVTICCPKRIAPGKELQNGVTFSEVYRL